LQKRHPPGALLRACEVEHECYPLFLWQKGWRMRPWGSRKGVGKYLSKLPGVEKVSPYLVTEDGRKERVRCYRLPLAAAEIQAAEWPRYKRAA
jgi:hypothetical protein